MKPNAEEVLKRTRAYIETQIADKERELLEMQGELSALRCTLAYIQTREREQ